MLRNMIKNKKHSVLALFCSVTLLSGCYSTSSTEYAFVANPPPPPVVIPNTPRQEITTVKIKPFEVASIEPSSGEYNVYLNEAAGCTEASGDALGYQWGKNSVGVKVGPDSTLRYRLKLGEDKQFKRPCLDKSGWHGYVRDGYTSLSER